MKMPPKSEEEQATEIQREIAMREIAWNNLCYHWQRFQSLDHEIPKEDDEKYLHSSKILDWITEYKKHLES